MAITDEAVWQAEERLWTDGGPAYPGLVHPDALFALPRTGIMTGAEATQAMAGNPGWRSVVMTDKALTRIGKTVIVIAYRGDGVRPDESTYSAHCASTYHAANEDWQLIQHSQTVID
ncbi:MAG: DUF4440 domain-containing protein [Alteraurantiacibacter sp.]